MGLKGKRKVGRFGSATARAKYEVKKVEKKLAKKQELALEVRQQKMWNGHRVASRNRSRVAS